jgi:hypothetical protein
MKQNAGTRHYAKCLMVFVRRLVSFLTPSRSPRHGASTLLA